MDESRPGTHSANHQLRDFGAANGVGYGGQTLKQAHFEEVKQSNGMDLSLQKQNSGLNQQTVQENGHAQIEQQKELEQRRLEQEK